MLKTVVKGVVCDSLNHDPLPGAVVTFTLSDNIYDILINRTTDKDGAFEATMNFRENGYVRMDVSYPGYKVYSNFLPWKKNNDMGRILLTPDVNKIDSVVVRVRQKIFSMRGDTAVYFPSAVKMPQHASLLDVMQRMPGVSVENGKVKVDDKAIERLYVNGKEVYGKNPMDGFKYIDAADASRLDIYEENDEASAVKYGEANARKRTVLNVITFKIFDQSLLAAVRGAYGADMDPDAGGSHTRRYMAGAGLRFFSERRQFSIDAHFDNVDFLGTTLDGSPVVSGVGDYLRTNALSLGYGDKIAGKWDVSGQYDLSNRYLRNGTAVTQTTYFATDDTGVRQLSDTVGGDSFQIVNDIRLSASRTTKTDASSFVAGATITDMSSHSRHASLSSLEGVAINDYRIREATDRTPYSINASGDWTHRFNGFSLNLNARSVVSNGDEDGWRRETSTFDDAGRVVLQKGTGRSVDGEAGIALTRNTAKAGSFSVAYKAMYTKNSVDNLAFDMAKNEVDSSRTRNFTNDYIDNVFSAGYNVNKKYLSANLGLEYKDRIFNKDDRFPQEDNSRYNFSSLLPSLGIRYSNRKIVSAGISFSSKAITPMAEQLMDKLDARNPMSLLGGNSHLNQQKMYNIEMSASRSFERYGFFMLSFHATITDNSIVSRRVFFADSTYLPQYDYYAQPGSTLTTYENAGRSIDLLPDINYHKQLFSALTIKVNLSYNYRTQPMYVDNTLAELQTRRISSMVDLMGAFTKKVDISLSYMPIYEVAHNGPGQVDRALIQRMGANLQYEISERLSFNANYNLYRHYSYDFASSRNTTHMLNAWLSYRMLKDRRSEIALYAYDILNARSDFQATVSADNITNRWRTTNGRYFLVSFSYKFRENK